MANIMRFVILGDDRGGPAFASFTKQVEKANAAVDRNNAALKRQKKSADDSRGGILALTGTVTGFGDAAGAASSKSSTFQKVLAGINLASGVLEPVLAGAVVAAGGLAAAFAAAGAGAAAYGVALKPLLSQTSDVMKAQETLDKARATAQAAYAAAIKSGASVKTADAARTKAMTAAQDQYNIAVKGTPGPVREFAKSVTAAQTTYKSWADSLARPVLGPLSIGLKVVGPALKAITPLVRVTAGAFGMLVTEISRKVSAGGLTSIVTTILPHVRDTILDLGHAAGNVAAGIWGILKAFLPVSGQITGGVVKLTARFKEWGQSLSGGTGFQSLMTTFREETPQAVAILTNLGTVIGNVGKAMFGLSAFSNSKLLLSALTPLSAVMAQLSKNTDLVRVAMYALLAVKIGQQFSWVTDAWKGIVKFAAAAEGATVAETIAAAATRAWGIAMAALPWVALAAAVVAVALLIIKYHKQIWAFTQRVWHDVLAVIMATWTWVKRNWPLLLAILTGPIGLAVLWITRHWTTLMTLLSATFNIFKERVRIVWDQIKLTFLRGVDFILSVMGHLPGPLGAPFRAAHKSIAAEMKGIQGDVAAATRNIQASIDKIHGKNVNVGLSTSGSGRIIITGTGINQRVIDTTTGTVHALGGHTAKGWLVSGGVPGRDSVPIMAMPGELVVPTAMVRAGAVDHLRGRGIPGFAAGGIVGGAARAVNATGAAEVGFGQSAALAFAKAAIAAAKAAAAAAAGPAVKYKPGAGVQQWRGTVSTALSSAGSSQQLVDAVLYQMQTESGGNPNIVNRWDSNWLAGHPSVGLMQVINSTYRAYAGRYRNTGPFEYGVSVNPLANVYAAIKYAQANYGPGLRNAYGGIGTGRGYALGTGSAAPGWAWVGERGPELVRFRGGEQVSPAGGGNTYQITVNVPPTASKADTGRVIVEHIRAYEQGSGKGWRR